MKIGIITLPLHYNYGGILQAYALQTIIERMGHSATIVEKEWVKYNLNVSTIFRLFKRYIKKYIFRKSVQIFAEKDFSQKLPIIAQNIIPFIKNNIKLVKIRSYSSLKEKSYDGYVVGSDQVWRPSYNKDIDSAFLSFTKEWNVIRLSYAASFGTSTWNYTHYQTYKFRKLLSLFSGIGVRENDAILLCKNYFLKEAVLTLDPTLLLNKDDYTKLIDSEPYSETNFLLNYILDNNCQIKELISIISKKKRLKSIKVNSNAENSNVMIEDRIQPSVESWLKAFRDTNMIITDSFHACVFAIIFNKPFVAIVNRSRGASRFESLLGQLDLLDHLLYDVDDYDINCNYEIPVKTYEVLERLKNKSMQFLVNYLKV